VLAARYGRARATITGLAMTGLGAAIGLASGAVSHHNAVHALWAA
jgi:hypothetical protein